MNSPSPTIRSTSADTRRYQFLNWQCRARQSAMRDLLGRPDSASIPSVRLINNDTPLGDIVTILNKLPAYSCTPELMHMAKRTFDPALRREKCIEFFSATYFQSPDQFSDVLTSTFSSQSAMAEQLKNAGECLLDFSGYGHEFTLQCKVWRLAKQNPLFQATWWHNHLFNPNLPADVMILGFEPDWSQPI